MPLIKYLSMAEMQAILNAPDIRTRSGIRDRAMLHVCFAAGLRVSELTGLLLTAVTLQPTPTLRVIGKGRKERSLPLWKQTASDVRAWLAVRGEAPAPELFLNASGKPMTRVGFTYLLRKHVSTAIRTCPSLIGKQVFPHLLRHYLPFRIMSGSGTPARYFGQIREVAHDIVLTPSISPMQGKGVHREVYYRLPSSSFASAGRPSRVTYRSVCEVTE
jgi:site-specific recombinase XerD